jgi:ubiquinone/menaquinone biosynthesis C-methylase UbiE
MAFRMTPSAATLTDQLRFTTIAHRDHVFLNPLSGPKVDQVLSMLELPQGARVLDVGCGKGEMLVRLAGRFGARGIGVDLNPAFIADARARAESRVPQAGLAFHVQPACDFPATPGSFDATLCVGSTGAYGGYRGALRALSGLVRPHGRVLVGERFWRRHPHPDYLAALDLGLDDLLDHQRNVRAGEEAGLVPICTAVSTEDEWDHYEGLYASAVEEHAAGHPEDAEAEAMWKRIRRHREAWEHWGRDTLGFGLYVFQKK